MIEERDGDIFKQLDLNCVAHQANCFHTMGSGIARIIREQFPEAYEADCETVRGDKNKLGTYSEALIKREDRYFSIANVYGQYGFGGRSQNPPVRDTQYDALYDGLKLLRDDVVQDLIDADAAFTYKLGIPYGVGSALGGAKWRVVSEMIYDIFEDSELITGVICRLEGTEDLS